LGGFIYSHLGKVPALGDRIEFENAVIEVLSVSGRRIKQVRATVTTPKDDASASERQPARPDGESNGRSSGFLSIF
jgi:Mg2+/Co2+ transporter CorC